MRFREEKEDGTVANKRLSGFRTKKEAQAGYLKYMNDREKEKNTTAYAADMLFSEMTERYIEFLSGRVKESSMYETHHRLNNRILPYFKDYQMKDITPVIILQWIYTLEGYSHTYKSTLITLLSSPLSFAERYYGVPNAAKNIDKPRNLESKKEMQFWTPEEFAIFIEGVEDIPANMFFRFLFETGCRRGEAEALSWSDIDFEKRTVRINKSVTRKISSAAYAVTTPKNISSNRTVTLSKPLCKMLADYKLWQKAHTEKQDFVFGGENPISNVERVLSKVCEKTGVKKIRIHDLRHSCASILISKGVSIVAVSKRLGHSSIDQTLNTYSHMLPDDEIRLTEIMNEISASLLTDLGTQLGTIK